MRRGKAGLPARTREGYVVRTHNFGEADRIVVLVTAEEGRVEGVAKGARRWKSGYGASLEPLSYVRAAWRERPGRELVRFERIELLTSSFELLSDPDALAAYSHVAELLQTVAVPGEAHPRLIRLVRALLDAGRGAGRSREAVAGAEAAGVREQGAGDAGAIVAARAPVYDLLALYFDVWVARLEGFWPDLGFCAVCGKELTGARRVGTHIEGALCRACATGVPGQTLGLGAEAASLALRFATLPPARLAEEQPSKASLRELRALVTALLTTHLEKRLRTLGQTALRSRRGS